MELANGETIVKQWNYGRTKEKKLGGEKADTSITVTNKRIISTVSSSMGVTQNEVYVKDVSSVYSKTVVPSKIIPIMYIILGVILFITGIIILATMGDVGVAGIIVMIIGVVFVVVGFILLSKTGFELVITTDACEGPRLEIGLSSIIRRRASAKIKVKVNREVVFQIQSAIGAIILNNKSSEASEQ